MREKRSTSWVRTIWPPAGPAAPPGSGGRPTRRRAAPLRGGRCRSAPGRGTGPGHGWPRPPGPRRGRRRLEVLAAQLHVLEHGPPVGLHDALVTEDLFDARGRPGGVGPQAGQLVGMAQQGEDGVADQVGGGHEPGAEEEPGGGHHLLGVSGPPASVCSMSPDRRSSPGFALPHHQVGEVLVLVSAARPPPGRSGGGVGLGRCRAAHQLAELLPLVGGTPTRSPITATGNGKARTFIRSTSPTSAMSSMIGSSAALILAARLAHPPGVKARLTGVRRRVCSGGLR